MSGGGPGSGSGEGAVISDPAMLGLILAALLLPPVGLIGGGVVLYKGDRRGWWPLLLSLAVIGVALIGLARS